MHILSIPGFVKCPGAGKKLTVKCPGAGNFFRANARGCPGGIVRVGIERDIAIELFKNFVLSDCRKAKLYLRMLIMVLRRFFHVEKKIDKLAQIQSLDGMRNFSRIDGRKGKLKKCA